MENLALTVIQSDENEWKMVIQDLEEGTGDIWLGLEGSKRLQYNLLHASKMTIVPVSPSQMPCFRETWGQESLLQSQHMALVSCMADDWLPATCSRAQRFARPSHQLDHLDIQGSSLGQLNPSVHDYHYLGGVARALDYAQATQPFEQMALLPLSPLIDEARLQVLVVQLPPAQGGRRSTQWHENEHVPFWRYIRELGSTCSRYELRVLRHCCLNFCDEVFPRGARNLVLTDHLFRPDDGWQALRVVVRQLLQGSGQDYLLPQSIVWRSRGSTPAAEHVNLESCRRHLDADPGARTRNGGTNRNRRTSLLARFYDVIKEMVGETYRRKREVEIVYSSESEDQSDSDTDDSATKMEKVAISATTGRSTRSSKLWSTYCYGQELDVGSW
jgi:hypothetical protein